MKTQKMAAMIITALFFSVASVSSAAQPSSEAVKEKVSEAAEAIKNFSVEQRNEALKKAQALLDDLDARIEPMESRLNEKWGQMDQTARQKMVDTLTALRKQRNEAAEWYGGLKHSSGNAWEDVKKGFLKSYRDLNNTFNKARSEF
ncbi:MAG: hypothetical protein KQI81_12545 [Deltaproteobacteria bacterium]|nr:hypothetical protein [Deltaproteobacteria bacterium]